MFWFTGNTPRVEGYIQDANAGTFYSAVSNIDFQIEEGNPAAVVMRAHFAQHGFGLSLRVRRWPGQGRYL